jgi:Flp pilus assembly protein TadD
VATCLVSGACATHNGRIDPNLNDPEPKFAKGGSGVKAGPSGSSALVQTVEQTNPELAMALALATAEPTSEHYRQVAEVYLKLSIVDDAFKYMAKAIAVEPESNNFEARARVWRDSGFPAIGLADAEMATALDPRSPTAHNTLGTILQAIGRKPEARRAYDMALTLDPHAAYVLNNLCYLSFSEGDYTRAITACRLAIELDPGLRAARNNLALAYADAGDVDRAKQQLFGSSGPAEAQYNFGILALARGDYTQAAEAFRAAVQLRPYWPAAVARVKQTDKLMGVMHDHD